MRCLAWGGCLLLIGIVSMLAGCRQPERPLRVGANIWPGYEPMYLARSLELYDGVPLQLLDFSSAAEVIRAYRNGLIDVAALTGDEAMLAAEGAGQHEIVLVCDFSSGADVLLARPEVQSLADLRGRRIGVETTALGAYVLGRALDLGGLATTDVEIVPVPLLEHVSAFTSGRVDAVVTFEPHRTQILASGARQVFDSTQIPGEIVDVLLARSDLADSQRRALETLVSGWFRALEYLQQNPADAAARIAPRESVTPEQFLESLDGLELPDREANLQLLGDSSHNLTVALRQLSAAMVKHKIVADPLEPPRLNDHYVQAARP